METFPIKESTPREIFYTAFSEFKRKVSKFDSYILEFIEESVSSDEEVPTFFTTQEVCDGQLGNTHDHYTPLKAIFINTVKQLENFQIDNGFTSTDAIKALESTLEEQTKAIRQWETTFLSSANIKGSTFNSQAEVKKIVVGLVDFLKKTLETLERIESEPEFVFDG